jgi:guanylate kinase
MPGLLENKKGLAFIISAPAGTGKTTLVRKLVQEFPSVVTSISYTTRSPRPGEVEGIDYHFITVSEFEKKIVAGDFLEYVKLYDTYYGTSRQWVEERQNQGKHVVLVIDTQGALQLKRNFSAVYIFIRPPSLEILKERLKKRQTEEPKMLKQRLDWAKVELEASQFYDYLIVNDDLDTAYDILRSIIIAECHRIKLLKG